MLHPIGLLKCQTQRTSKLQSIMDIPISIALLHKIFELYAFAAAIRMLAQYANVDFNHPFSQFIHRITRYPIDFFRLFLPRIRGSDLLSPFLLTFITVGAENFLAMQAMNYDLSISKLLYRSAAGLLELVVTVYIFAVLARVVFSWVSKMRISPFALLLLEFTEPIMRPARRIVPAVGGLDFSPIVVLIGLNVIQYIGTEILLAIARPFWS